VVGWRDSGVPVGVVRRALGSVSGCGVVRGRRGAVEAARDREWLRWIGRFRFVTAGLLAERFGVSVQQANARVRRLAAAGLVIRSAGAVGQAHVVALTRTGARQVGLPERRAPRGDAQREHELSLVALVGELEAQLAGHHGLLVWTERECRQRQALGLGDYSLAVFGGRVLGGEERWPDVVLERGEQRVAFELELAPKAPQRLWGESLATSATRGARWTDRPAVL
jgi:DNA-binding MarR family transcriptional regulator